MTSKLHFFGEELSPPNSVIHVNFALMYLYAKILNLRLDRNAVKHEINLTLSTCLQTEASLAQPFPELKVPPSILKFPLQW